MKPRIESHDPLMPHLRPLRPILFSLTIGILALALTACQPLGASVTALSASMLSNAPAQPTLSPEEVVPPLPTAAPAPVTPVRLAIPAIQMDVPVQPMGWRVSNSGGIAVEWVLPTDAAGWHVTSAPAGGPGNTVISGSQFDGAAVFAPLALGDAKIGQDIILTDSEGMTFTYSITQVPEPLPLRGADAGAAATAKALVEQAGPTRLTLITGWPSFTTTHRQFVVAELVGE